VQRTEGVGGQQDDSSKPGWRNGADRGRRQARARRSRAEVVCRSSTWNPRMNIRYVRKSTNGWLPASRHRFG